MKDSLPRIAMVTPLPPELTGIAEYVAILLPALASHFHIDLYTTASVSTVELSGHRFHAFPWQQLQANRGRYREVVYQFGNSPFHSHMVELLDKVPGIVVLHDFYLSSMLAHMDLHEGHSGLFEQELARSHGAQATAMLAQDGAWETAKHFPASRRIIERAKAVIVHSRHSGEMRKRYFPTLGALAWTNVPMPQMPVRAIDDEERSKLRARLGFSSSDFVVISLGFLADTKLNHVLLQAMQGQALASDASIRVVFVGENDGGDYGRSLNTQIQSLPQPGRVSITGFVDAADYADYMAAADCAVQLRTRSRGETSKAVHDCMSHGLPVIVNDYASFSELPRDAVCKIASDPSPQELAQAILTLKQDKLKGTLLGLFAKHHMYTENSAERVAARYAEVIDGRMPVDADAAQSGPREQQEGPAGLGNDAAKQDARQLLIDLSEVVKVDYGTGIHRVVRNLTRELLSMDRSQAWSCVPVVHGRNGGMESAWGYAREKLGVEPAGQDRREFAPQDKLFMVDSVWEQPERFSGTIDRLQAAGGEAGAMVYDLIPLRHPGYCVDYMPAVFERWLRFVVARCDFIVCISRAVADDLQAWIVDQPAGIGRTLRIGHIHLGSDVSEGGHAASPPSAAIRTAVAGGDSTLMVGTVEPRKRYDLALAAFEALWEQGSQSRLVIIGKPGWNVEALAQRLGTHPERNRRLFWLEQASNADIDYAYRTCARLLQASDAEGFGLPIIEAARYGRPLVLSDIPVFREIAGDDALYFATGDIHSLTRALMLPPKPPGSIRTLTWNESATRLLDLIEGRSWDHYLSPTPEDGLRDDR